jgi:hypothetical protein
MAKFTISKMEFLLILGCFILCILFMGLVSWVVVGLREQQPLFQTILSVKFDQSCSPIGQLQSTPQLNCATFGEYRVWFTGEGRALQILFGQINENGTAAVAGKLHGSAYIARELGIDDLQLTDHFDQAKFMQAVAL